MSHWTSHQPASDLQLGSLLSYAPFPLKIMHDSHSVITFILFVCLRRTGSKRFPQHPPRTSCARARNACPATQYRHFRTSLFLLFPSKVCCWKLKRKYFCRILSKVWGAPISINQTIIIPHLNYSPFLSCRSCFLAIDSFRYRQRICAAALPKFYVWL